MITIYSFNSLKAVLNILIDFFISFNLTLSGGRILTTFSAALIVNNLLSINFWINLVWSLCKQSPINNPLEIKEKEGYEKAFEKFLKEAEVKAEEKKVTTTRNWLN